VGSQKWPCALAAAWSVWLQAGGCGTGGLFCRDLVQMLRAGKAPENGLRSTADCHATDASQSGRASLFAKACHMWQSPFRLGAFVPTRAKMGPARLQLSAAMAILLHMTMFSFHMEILRSAGIQLNRR